MQIARGLLRFFTVDFNQDFHAWGESNLTEVFMELEDRNAEEPEIHDLLLKYSLDALAEYCDPAADSLYDEQSLSRLSNVLYAVSP